MMPDFEDLVDQLGRAALRLDECVREKMDQGEFERANAISALQANILSSIRSYRADLAEAKRIKAIEDAWEGPNISSA